MNHARNRDKIISQIKRIFTNMDKIEEKLKDAEQLSQTINTARGASLEASVPEESLPFDLKSIVEAGSRGIAKIRSGRNAEITKEEETGLEAIVLVEGRPAIKIDNNDFLTPPSEWEHLKNYRDNIKSTILSSGRIEVQNYPDRLDYIGSASLIAEDVIMTNEHVAIAFSRPSSNGKWTFKYGPVSVDYGHDLSDNENPFNVEEVIGVHNEYDLALLRISADSSSSMKLPKPLPIAKDFDDDKVNDKECYIIGFPAWDGRRNDPAVMHRIFGNLYGFKRLQPGKLRNLIDGTNIVEHDCSTLGGNSGSCVVDLETNKVVGLHFSGRFAEINHAVALWKLIDDPLLKSAGIQFG